MITPQTNPNAFRVQQVGTFQFYVYNIHPISVDEDIQFACNRYWRDAYKAMHPESLKDGKVVATLYDAWAMSDESNTAELLRGEKKCRATILFIPKDGAPPIAELWDTELTTDVYYQVASFTKPILPDSTNANAISA